MNQMSFFQFWEQVRILFKTICEQYDGIWRLRKRCIDTQMLVLFIFRSTIASDKRGYGCTLVEIFNRLMTCEKPVQIKEFSDAAVCKARYKLDPNIFKLLNDGVIDLFNKFNPEPLLWRGHRLFGIDGSKFVLPRELIQKGYITYGEHIHYPHGLVSCMYDLLTGIPHDFEVTHNMNERKSAIKHLQKLQREDVVVMDRGYFSFELASEFVRNGVDLICRLPNNQKAGPIYEFWNSDKTDEIIEYKPSKDIENEVQKGALNISLKPITLRLIKYKINEITYVIATTLLDKEKYPATIFPEAYHARWGLEELLKVSKTITGVKFFHSKNEKGIKQELYAHFLIMTFQKIIESESRRELFKKIKEKTQKTIFRRIRKVQKTPEAKKPIELLEIKINQKNAFITLSNIWEKFFFSTVKYFTEKVIPAVLSMVRKLYQKKRPDRSYPRESKQPTGKWHRPGVKLKKAFVIPSPA